MRPVRLEMQAFGPYLRRQTLDFRELEIRAGKSSSSTGRPARARPALFDAMSSRALWAGPAAIARSPSFLEQAGAAGRLYATEVVFDFAIGEEYFRCAKASQVPRGSSVAATRASSMEESLAEFNCAWRRTGPVKLPARSRRSRAWMYQGDRGGDREDRAGRPSSSSR